MPKYGFSSTSIFPYEDKVCPYMEIHWSEKTHILEYFTQCGCRIRDHP